MMENRSALVTLNKICSVGSFKQRAASGQDKGMDPPATEITYATVH